MTDSLFTLAQFAVALVFVIALIVVLANVARRFGFGGAAAARLGRGHRRLAISEVLSLDGRRRLVLVRRDEVEHLVILGPGSETVVEAGIPTPQPADFARAVRKAAAGGAATPAVEPAVVRSDWEKRH